MTYQKNKEWLKQILDVLEAHFGSNVEFVLHDLTLDYEYTIIDIRNGEITGRKIGDTRRIHETHAQHIFGRQLVHHRRALTFHSDR
jgi:predicted transcriptional regulator YheO